MIALLAIGVIVGAASLRDSIVQEFGDISVALDRLNQTYSYRIELDPDGNGPAAPQTIWFANYTDPLPTLEDNVDEPPAGITFVEPTGGESPVTLPVGSVP
ncbi:hypothetical protein AB1L30_26335 [Bremerella sp. JC817]|uniref:hypothetical protein n=1 Tax=Bremerella sp. JC817 TaxID=3231756 RepID=UPI0034594C7C